MAWQFWRAPKLLVVGARANVHHLPHEIAEDFLGDGAVELVAGHLPGVDAQRTRASCELS
jgi:hypothetical protein